MTMRVSFSLFGREVWAIDWSRPECGCVEEVEEDYSEISGGSTHNFERDAEGWGCEEGRARFGFGGLA